MTLLGHHTAPMDLHFASAQLPADETISEGVTGIQCHLYLHGWALVLPSQLQTYSIKQQQE